MTSPPKFNHKGFGSKHNSLFGPGPNFRLNACVGRNGGSADLWRFAKGYFNAGERLVKSLQDNPEFVDGVIYPLVMIYRHGVEVSLKYVGRLLPRLLDEKVEIQLTHKLWDNWKVVRSQLMQLEVEENELTTIDSLLKDLIEIDPNGEVFRYPQSRDGKKLLQETSLINVETFAAGATQLATFFDCCCAWAADMYQQKCDMEYEMQQATWNESDYGW